MLCNRCICLSNLHNNLVNCILSFPSFCSWKTESQLAQGHKTGEEQSRDSTWVPCPQVHGCTQWWPPPCSKPQPSKQIPANFTYDYVESLLFQATVIRSIPPHLTFPPLSKIWPRYHYNWTVEQKQTVPTNPFNAMAIGSVHQERKRSLILIHQPFTWAGES